MELDPKFKVKPWKGFKQGGDVIWLFSVGSLWLLPEQRMDCETHERKSNQEAGAGVQRWAGQGWAGLGEGSGVRASRQTYSKNSLEVERTEFAEESDKGKGRNQG